jgi:hypothetical protein
VLQPRVVPVAQMIAMDHNGLSETFFRRKESSMSQASSTRISLNRVTLVAGFAASRVPWLDRFTIKSTGPSALQLRATMIFASNSKS